MMRKWSQQKARWQVDSGFGQMDRRVAFVEDLR